MLYQTVLTVRKVCFISYGIEFRYYSLFNYLLLAEELEYFKISNFMKINDILEFSASQRYNNYYYYWLLQ